MAYLDATNPQRNVGTFAVVAALEAGLAIALIAGLSYKYTTTPDEIITTTDIPLPPPPKPVEDPVKPPAETPRTIDRPIVTKDPVERDPGAEIITPSEGKGGGAGLEIVAFPTPTPSPVPSFTPIKVRPRGDPGLWVTESDYPSSAIRLGQQGRTGFRLSVDAAGKVTSCTVTASSGSPVLDNTACEKLARRARFSPAIDNTGAKTEGTYLGVINWRLPEE